MPNPNSPFTCLIRYLGHQHFHKRAVVTDYATVTSPEVVVWVFPDGQTASIETRTPGIASATAAPQRVGSESSVESIHTPEPSASDSTSNPLPLSPVQAYAESSSPSKAGPTSEAPSPPPAPSSEAGPQKPAPASAQSPPPPPPPSSNGLGICYSPYNADGTCKSQDQVNSDFNSLSSYSVVRIYGVDCNQIRTVHSAASAKGIKLFAGLLTIADVPSDLASMIKQLNGKFDSTITTISIGNELVDTGRASPADVVAALGIARAILTQAGYGGSIVTVDTFNALIAHPELCRASDYCAANAHSYFDGTIEPAAAGAWVQRQVNRISDAAGGGKKTVITESGWPHAGHSNGVAVPSLENQAKAMQSIRDAFGADLFLFSAFDDKWKADGAWGVEKYFGIM